MQSLLLDYENEIISIFLNDDYHVIERGRAQTEMEKESKMSFADSFSMFSPNSIGSRTD